MKFYAEHILKVIKNDLAPLRLCGKVRPMLKILLPTFTILLAQQSWANGFSKDSLALVNPPVVSATTISGARVFPEINRAYQSQSFDPITVNTLVVDDSLQQKRARAHSLRDDVEKAQRFRETLDAFSVIDLPVGIVKSGGALDYSIVIDKITFNTQGSILDAYVSFTIPQTGDRIAFGGLVPLSHDGGIVGTAKIYLLGDHYIKLSETSLLTLVGSKNAGTFVEIDCNGFKGMSVEAVVEFSKDVLKPEDAKGKVIDNERLKINFRTYIQDWNELLVKVNIPPFQVSGLKDIGFRIEDAYMDWSDLTNPPGLAFPAGYESAYLTAGNNNLWRGFFLKKAEIRLPNKLSEAGSGQRTAIGVEDMVIDDTGFSGKIFAEHLIQAGDMNGWSFTLDRFKAGVVSNQLEEFEFVGLISVPAFKKGGKDAQMGYRASRGADDNYIFSVALADEVTLPLWAADVSLYKGSSITVSEKNDKFYPSATLNGMISIKTLSKGPKAEISGVRFENLVLSTEAPYFKPGTFGVGSAKEGSKASGFPLVIKSIGVKSNTAEKKVGIMMDVTINISGKAEEEGFSGTAGLIVWGDMNAPAPPASNTETLGSQSTASGWAFDKVELTAVGISIKKPGVYELAGLIRFFDNDALYGDGFNGSLTGKFKDKITVQANTIFGKTLTYRYWYADALVGFNSGLVLAPGFAAYSFGGGFYSKMKQSAGGSGNSLGMSASGIVYVPDENSMGLRAYMDFGGQPKKETYNGDVTLEIAMNRNGGINKISFIGNAYFLTPDFKVGTELIKAGASKVASGAQLTQEKTSPKSQVYGSIKLLFDNENDVFHGDIEVYVNVVGGLVKGIGAGNKAGWAVLHFASDDWYVLIGTPDQPVGLEVARLFKSKSYFMVGKNLPGSPPPPAKVSEILGGVDLDYMRDMNALQSGLGLAFGMSFGVDTGDLRFLMFYGRFAAGTGFDIMLKNYGTSYHCEGSNEPLGINGWYANGQAYAFVEGKIGIRVNLRFYKGNYDIIAIGAAAILQAKGPNPFWMKGTVGGYYRILGGLVKGHCKFDVTIGKECKPVGESNPLQDVAIIADMSPAKGTNEVDVFNTPQVAFNIPIGENFEITDLENNKKIFRATLAEFSVKSGAAPIGGVNKWNSTNDVVVMNSHDILPPKKEVKAFVKVVFEESIGGSWVPVKFEGKPVEETMETTFTTGDAPDYIPASNVEYSYPIAGQYNFYPEEYKKGFIQLKKGQPYLFENDPKWMKKGRMTEDLNNKRFVEMDFTYDQGAKKVNYLIPDGISLATIYRFELLNIPKYSQVIDANVEKVSTELIAGDEGAAQLTTKKVEGQVEQLETKSIYGSELRTSKYRLFTEKMSAVNVGNVILYNVNPVANIHQLVGILNEGEIFDSFEINGSDYFGKLIQIEADLGSNVWYNDYVYPLVYDGYPILGKFRITDRDIGEFGLPPKLDNFINQALNQVRISADGEIMNMDFSKPFRSVVYNLPYSMKVDYWDIQRQAANYVATKMVSIDRLNFIILSPFPVIRPGRYKIDFKYVIPGATDRQPTVYSTYLNN